LLSLTVLLHSVSIYAMPMEVTDDVTSLETTHDTEQPVTLLKALDALIPSIQAMAPIVLYFIHEVVLLNEHQYLELPVSNGHENQYLEILFPLIISPNAP
jgi:hypothetical protein